MQETATLSALLACTGKAWAPGIGDPNLTGWLTVLSYGICAALAGAVLRRSPSGAARGFWLVVLVLMIVLGINKQLDLQSALTAFGRCLARAQGWYQDRRAVQGDFLLVLAGATLVVLVGLFAALAGRWRQNGLAMAGLPILGGFVLMRAVGFHHFDKVLGLRAMGVSVNFLFENAGLALIAANAWILLRSPAPRRRRRRRHPLDRPWAKTTPEKAAPARHRHEDHPHTGPAQDHGPASHAADAARHGVPQDAHHEAHHGRRRRRHHPLDPPRP